MTLVAAAPISLRNLIIGLNIAAGVFLLGVLVAAVRERRRRLVRAPNKIPYLEDDLMEGPRLERILAWALGLFALIAITLPLYWLLEPHRQDAMSEQYQNTSIEQGSELFAPAGSNHVALGCADCHGPKGQGGATVQIVTVPKADITATPGATKKSDRVCIDSPDDKTKMLCQVTWQAPPLNTVFLRFSRDEITQIVTYGRPGTPMPSWGVAGGGAKDEQSISNIVDFLQSIQLSSDKAKAEMAGITDGQTLFELNCARCHTKYWSFANTFAQSSDFDIFGVPGGGAFGPNLTGGSEARQFPKVDDQVGFVSDGSVFQKPYGERGIGSGLMPGFSQMLTQDQIKAIVDYERGLLDQRAKLDDLAAAAQNAANQAQSGGGSGETTTTTPSESTTTTTSGSTTTTTGGTK